MFDFAWSEIALVGVVALIAIGPKDMPVAIRSHDHAIKKMRRMAGEFQGQWTSLSARLISPRCATRSRRFAAA